METITQYIAAIDPKWQESYQKLLDLLKEQLPAGFELVFQYGMPTFVVPLSTFSEGYLKRANEPLPFISLAAQKRYLALYHMGLVQDKELLRWFQEAYRQQAPAKLNMGKSCIRFTNPNKIPYELLAALFGKITPEQWTAQYQAAIRKKAEQNQTP